MGFTSGRPHSQPNSAAPRSGGNAPRPCRAISATLRSPASPWTSPVFAHTPHAMLNAGKDQAAVLQALEVSQSTLDRWRAQYGGMKAEEAKRLKELEDENRRLKQLVADLSLDNQMLKHVASGNW